MTEQLTPEQNIADNGRICEKLLGWQPGITGWIKPDGFMYGGCGTPRFDTWAEAGLILEALIRESVDVGTAYRNGDCWYCEINGSVHYANAAPLAIRAAALEYIKSLPCDCCTPKRKCPDHGACVTDGEV